jgi:glycosyltransferase involved in cell wall biosynthesis
MIKVLYFGDCTGGAMGIIHRDIKSIIDEKYPDIQFELMDWAEKDNYVYLFNQKAWKNWDLIIVDPYIAKVLDSGWLFKDLPIEEQNELKDKFIPVYHHEVDVPADHFNHGWYEGWFTTPICSINPYIVNQIKSKGVESHLLPIGVNRKRFYPFKQITQIQNVGFVGSSPKEDWQSIKRPDMFHEICNKAEVESVVITNRPNDKSMYHDVDMIICPSTAEGLPTYFAEATACKIPFISTDIGIVRYHNTVKKFKTVDEAVQIINEFKDNPILINEYASNVYDEMFPDRDWEFIIEKYWVPYFKKMNKRFK